MWIKGFGVFVISLACKLVNSNVFDIITNSVLAHTEIEAVLYDGDGNDCISGYFKCNSSNHCVVQRKNCDNSADCPDGSDEWNCVDETGDNYWDLKFRKRPGAENDVIAKPCMWADTNSTCFCRDDEVNCEFKNLRHLPHSLPVSGLSLLDLTGNVFPILDETFFQNLVNVKILILKHCNVEVLKSNAFRILETVSISQLYLDQNQIKYLPEYLFPTETWLHILVLSGNQIATIHERAFENLFYLEELDLRDNKIEQVAGDVFKPLTSLAILYLNGNYLTNLQAGMFPVLHKLETLYLTNNRIRTVAKDALDFPMLEHLFLSDNIIDGIKNQTFHKLPRLTGLHLSANKINWFELAAFGGVENLTSLYLKDNLFDSMDDRVLKNLTHLQHIYFSWFHLCRAAMHVRVCEPRGDGISSTRHLLDNTVLRTSVWIMAGVAVFGNLLVLFGRFLFNNHHSQTHAEHSLYLRHLAVSDLLMGIYLAIIASADIMFRGEYLLHEQEWRHHSLCAICGFLSTLSCQSSTLLLTLVTWDRLISVIRPLQPRSANKTRAALRLTTLWSAAGAVAAAPLSGTNYFGKYFYGSNGVCLSIHIHDPYAKGWEYSATIFILVNTFSLLFIVISYLRMLRAIRGSGEAMRSTLSGRENVVARRFAIIVATDCACWLPVIVVKLVALAGIKISPSLYAWMAVLVLPVNSALNPVLYTLTTAQFKQQLLKFYYTLPCGASRRDSQNGFDTALSISLGQQPPSQIRLLQRKATPNTSLTSSSWNKRATIV